MNIQHSMRNDSWQTPDHVLELVQKLFEGRIDLDPASDEQANQRVKAQRIITREHNALECSWGEGNLGNIYLNPPGGKLKNKSLVRLFWRKLMTQRFDQAVFMAFSCEALQTTQGDVPCMLDFPICIPRKRICFISPDGLTKIAPSHSNAIVYIPGEINHTEEFLELFTALGKTKR